MIANDFAYSEVFAQQLNLEAKEGDCLITFSASGNSINILSVISEAKNMKMKTVAFTGFDGGTARNLVDFPIHVETEIGAYGSVEDIHLALVHYLVERFRSAHSR
ncbi:MAG: SIS domain-containing protein [Nitrosopumilaceae archaeon]|nr:SIS domain-containing protein [Nitrosopumilaceae archaeon]